MKSEKYIKVYGAGSIGNHLTNAAVFLGYEMVVVDVDKKAFQKNMQYNQKFQNKLYKDEYSLLLLTKMIQEFILFCKKNNKKPVLTIIPQPLDIIDQKKNNCYYQEFFSQFDTQLLVIDLMDFFLKHQKTKVLYEVGHLGDHVNKVMNKEIAKHLEKKLIKEKYISRT